MLACSTAAMVAFSPPRRGPLRPQAVVLLISPPKVPRLQATHPRSPTMADGDLETAAPPLPPPASSLADDPSSASTAPPPADRLGFAYLIFFTLGAGFLLPWNAFITAVDYFTFLYPGAPVDRAFCISYMVAAFLPLVSIMLFFPKLFSWDTHDDDQPVPKHKLPNMRKTCPQKIRKKWSEIEEKTLLQGVENMVTRGYDKGNWKNIKLAYPDVFKERSTVDLKDKFKNLEMHHHESVDA